MERSITFCTQDLQTAWYAATGIWSSKYPNMPQPFLTCTYRSPEEQTKLYNQAHDGIDNDHDGKIDEPDEKVTNAKAGQSYHNFYPSKAFDVAFKNKDGSLNWTHDLFVEFANIMKQVDPELVWGGTFSHLPDYPHFETHRHESA